MATKRIKDLTLTTYNGSYKIAVDDQTNGTKSLELSSACPYTLVVCTQAEYEASEKKSGVFYFIKES